MTDLTKAIIPKSDQLNADDLIAGPRTIRITRVETRDSKEQPVSVYFEGDQGKPWKPCKSMCRVLVIAWGGDGKRYTGRSVTLYREPKVTWGGLEVGGIRISHLSHIDSDMTMMLTESKSKRVPFRVRKLEATQDAPTKERGNLEATLKQISKWEGDLEMLRAAIYERSWTKAERAQIEEALAARKAPE